MNKKVLLNRFGKVFLLVGFVFAISGIKNANAQANRNDAFEIRCIVYTKYINTHKLIDHIGNPTCVSWGWNCPHCATGDPCQPCTSYCKKYNYTSVAKDQVRNISVEPSSISVCTKWGMFIAGKQINTTGDLLEKIPATELLKIYDPNLLRN